MTIISQIEVLTNTQKVLLIKECLNLLAQIYVYYKTKMHSYYKIDENRQQKY